MPVLAETTQYKCQLQSVELENQDNFERSYGETGPIGSIETGIVSLNFPQPSYIYIGNFYITGDISTQGKTVVLKEHIGYASFNAETKIAKIVHLNTTIPRKITYRCK